MRDPALAIADCERSAAILGFKPIHLGFSTDAMELTPSDHHTVEILKLITKYKIDTLITAWAHDAHPAHRATNQIAMAATRKIPTVLTCRLSWNSVPEGYKPNFFVDVSDTLEDKIIALKCYKDEWLRTGVLWEKYIRAIASVYGLEANFEAAEGFEVIKLCQ